MSQDIPRQIFPRFDKTATRSQYKEQTKYPAYLANLRKCPCVICGITPSEAAHLRMSSAEYFKSNGRRDRWALSLCAVDHRLGPKAQHTMGEQKFWDMHGIDPLPLADAMWNARNDLEKMCEIALNRG